MSGMRRALWVVLSALAVYSVTVRADVIDVGSGYAYTTISSAVGAANPGDEIVVHSGTYTEGQIWIDKANLTIRGAAGEPMPRYVSTHGTDWNHCSLQIAASGVTIQGLDISHQSGPGTGRYLVGEGPSGAPQSDWTLQNSKVHGARRGVWSGGSNVSILGSEFYNLDNENVHLVDASSFTVRGNWFHDSAHMGSGTAAVWIRGNSCTAGTASDVSFNYIAGTRAGIILTPDTDGPLGTLQITHNTIDGSWRGTPGSSPYNSQGIAFYNQTNAMYNSANLDVRDNLFYRIRWYAMYEGEGDVGGFNGDLTVRNSLFYDCFWEDGWYPTYAYPEEWPGPRGAVGWVNWGDDMVMLDCILEDPLFWASGLDPEEYYALVIGSPAYATATDGLNIGAWQGSPVPEPGTILAFLTLAAGALVRRLRHRRD